MNLPARGCRKTSSATHLQGVIERGMAQCHGGAGAGLMHGQVQVRLQACGARTGLLHGQCLHSDAVIDAVSAPGCPGKLPGRLCKPFGTVKRGAQAACPPGPHRQSQVTARRRLAAHPTSWRMQAKSQQGVKKQHFHQHVHLSGMCRPVTARLQTALLLTAGLRGRHRQARP